MVAPPLTDSSTPGVGLPAPEAVVAARGLTKRYRGVTEIALDGVSLTIKRGEVYALLGPNGAGKTTTVELLVGLRARTGGEVSTLGVDPATRAGRAEVMRRAGIVLQRTGYPRYLTVDETLAMFARYFAAPRSVEDVRSLVGLEGLGSRLVRRLSGGQQRRLDLGVALVGRPDLLVLDEPTTGFDPEARRRTWAMIEALRDEGLTVLLTTHYIEEAQHLADRVGLLVAGQITVEGTSQDLARRAGLVSTVSFTLPEGCSLPRLAEGVVAHTSDGGRTVVRAEEPTALLAHLCGWAAENGIELGDLRVTPPSLEDSYLAITDGGAA